MSQSVSPKANRTITLPEMPQPKATSRTAPIPVAIVGTGAVAQHHARHLKANTNVKLIAVVDTNLEAASDFARKWSVPEVYDSLESLLAKSRVEAVHITTPPESHEHLSRQALASGLDVLVEKPVAFSHQTTEALYELAKRHGARLIPDYSLFFTAEMIRARDAVRENRIGRIVSVECLYQTTLDRGRLDEPSFPNWLFSLPAGPLHNFFTHPLYLALEFTGAARNVSVHPRHTGFLPQRMSDHLDMVIEGERCNAYVNVSLRVAPTQILLVLHGEKGRISVEFESFQISTDSAPARFGSVIRLLRPSLRGLEAIKQTGETALRIMRRKLVPYAGLKALIDKFYSLEPRAEALIPDALVIEVARVEEEILRAPGVWKLTYPRACTITSPAKRSGWVAVTGGTGYLGRRVVAELRKRGNKVRLLQRWQSRAEAPEGQDVELVYGDARNPNDLRRLLQGTEAIVHLAAGMRGSRQFVVDSCEQATRNIVQISKEFGISRNIYVSSMAVVDYVNLQSREAITELSPVEESPTKRSAYAWGKTLAEQVLGSEMAQHKLPWMILRPSQIFGGSAGTVNQLGTRIGNRVVFLGSPGKCLRLVHVDDVARAVADFIQPENFRSGKTVNLTHPDKFTAREAAELLKECRQQGALYLRPFIGKILAWGTRFSHSILKRGPHISKQQAAYLFSEHPARADEAAKLGWKPSASLKDQVRESLNSSPSRVDD